MLTRAKDILQGKISISDPKRSPQWTKVRNGHLVKHPACEVCGGTKSLNVHHIKAYNTNPELELDATNLITLCESGNRGINCHLLMGHVGNYKKINPRVKMDSKIWKKKLI